MSVRKHKAEMYEKLKNKRGTKEYEEWFLKYSPTTNNLDKQLKKKKRKTRRRNKKNKKTRKKRSEYLF